MSQTLIFAPMLVMVLLTFSVLFLGLKLRIRAVKRGEINPVYFRFNRGGKPPEYLLKAEQHYLNLFELPVLFYALVLALFTTQQVDAFQLFLAWLFVATRLLHSWIHLTHNKIIWRMRSFITGSAVLIISWLDFAISLFGN